MNRAARRRQAAQARANAKPNPGPAPDARVVMEQLVVDAARQLPGFNVTVIISQKEAPAGQRPHYLLRTSASKRDILEIMMSLIDKEYAAAKKAEPEPASG